MDDDARAMELSRSWFGNAGSELAASDVAHLAVARLATVDLARVSVVFGDGAADWLGALDGLDPSGLRRFLCDLELPVSPDGRGLFRKAAVVSLGLPVSDGDRWRVPLEWRAATLAPLFPVFSGELSVAAGEVALAGSYAPPLGVVGQVLDRALLSIAARGTARWFLARLAAALSATEATR
jgi:hypothetical protein